MTQCYAFQGDGSDGRPYAFIACATNPSFIPNPSSPGGTYFSPASDGQRLIGSNSWWTTAGNIILCRNQADVDRATAGRGVGGSCSGCLEQPYDCINGQCILASQYKTPGVYASLTDCQSVCANGGSCGEGKQCVDPNTYCAPGKVCIDQSEFNEINGLVGVISGKFC